MTDSSSLQAVLGAEMLEDLRGIARDDLLDAHIRARNWIATPGTWLTGAERVAVVEETLQAASCKLCRDRKDALTPYAVEGDHDSLGTLDDLRVEVIHRIATDSGRLTGAWVDDLKANGLSDGDYVEIVSLVAMTKMMDAFLWATGTTAAGMPAPKDGAPTGYRPPGAKMSSAWVPLVAPEDLTESDGELYGGTAGFVLQALSLVPDSQRAFWALGQSHYIPMTEIRDPDTKVRAISRAQIEILAGRTSALHGCMY